MWDLTIGFQASPRGLPSSDPNHTGLRFVLPGLPGPESSLGSYLWLQQESTWVLSHYSGLTLGLRLPLTWQRGGTGWSVPSPRQPLTLTPCKGRGADRLSLQCKRLRLSVSEKLFPVRGEVPRLGTG